MNRWRKRSWGSPALSAGRALSAGDMPAPDHRAQGAGLGGGEPGVLPAGGRVGLRGVRGPGPARATAGEVIM
jgi:hypothetical protein